MQESRERSSAPGASAHFANERSECEAETWQEQFQARGPRKGLPVPTWEWTWDWAFVTIERRDLRLANQEACSDGLPYVHRRVEDLVTQRHSKERTMVLDSQ